MLATLLNIPIGCLGDVQQIKVWKQSKRIDLWIEVDTNQGDYAVIIETKAYSSLHDNQLARYKDIFENYYQNKDRNLCYSVVVLDDIIKEETKLESENNGYKIFSFETIYNKLSQDFDGKLELTGCDFFDEFWFGTWH